MIGIVYSARTGRIRSIVVPDPGETVNVSLLPGEQLEELPDDVAESEIPDVGSLQVQLSATTGRMPAGNRSAIIGLISAGDRYAVVTPDGDVVGALFGDPDCGDSVPGCDLIASDEAGPGWTYADGQFIAPPVGPVVPR